MLIASAWACRALSALGLRVVIADMVTAEDEESFDLKKKHKQEFSTKKGSSRSRGKTLCAQEISPYCSNDEEEVASGTRFSELSSITVTMDEGTDER